MDAELLVLATNLAGLAHDGQTRKSTGIPYLVHPMAVAVLVQSYGGTDEMVLAAILHDTLEDTKVHGLEIEKLFGRTVRTYVDFVTRSPNESYQDFLVRASKRPETATIKYADMMHNYTGCPFPSLTERYEKGMDFMRPFCVPFRVE